MPELLDLNFLPVARTAGKDYPELQCLYAAQPPRHPARGRDNDRLALYLAMTGNAPLPPGKQDQVLGELARLYYNTPGSVTAGLRRVAEELNASLLERNLRLAGSSRQSWGVLVQLVLRGSQLYLAHSGPAQAFLIAAMGTEYFYDPEQQDRGLGQSKATPISFFQAALQPNDTLLLAAQPSPEWSMDSLAGVHGQGPESLRRKLFNPAIADLNAVLIQARPGKGMFYLPGPGKAPAPRPASAPAAPPAAVQKQAPAEVPAAAASAAIAAAPGGTVQVTTPAFPAPAPPMEEMERAGESAGKYADEPPWTAPAAPRDLPPVVPSTVEPAPAPPRRPASAVFASMAAVLVAGMQTVGRGLGTLLVRVLPGEPFQSLPSSFMAFVALAVPVTVVLVSSMAYLRLGRDVTYETLMAQAQQMAERGLEQQDVAARKADLETAMGLLNKAETYRVASPAVEVLRSRVQAGLDDLDLVQRVEYQPAIINGLPPAVRVTRIAVIDEDLYLLDGATGNVLRASLTREGYQLDDTFQCGPMPGGNPPAGPLIDIAAWPAGYKPPASLLGMDATGTVVYCETNEAPRTERLKQPSAEAWGGIAGFTLDLGDTYVLDVPSKGIWIYWRSNFAEDSSMFFNDEIPVLDDVVDLTVNREDLYLLHLDGSLTLCNYSAFQGVPTRCTNPNYKDFRPGRENMPLVPPAPFIQIQNTQPPDPSLFLLEGQARAIYHFSLRNLTFQRQYLPAGAPGSGSATAFAVDNIRRRLFLAVGSQVYYAVLP